MRSTHSNVGVTYVPFVPLALWSGSSRPDRRRVALWTRLRTTCQTCWAWCAGTGGSSRCSPSSASSAAYEVTARQPKVYESATSVLVQPTGAGQDTNVSGGRTKGEINLDTEAQLVRSRPRSPPTRPSCCAPSRAAGHARREGLGGGAGEHERPRDHVQGARRPRRRRPARTRSPRRTCVTARRPRPTNWPSRSPRSTASSSSSTPRSRRSTPGWRACAPTAASGPTWRASAARSPRRSTRCPRG